MRFLFALGILFFSSIAYPQHKTESFRFLEDFFSLKLRTDTAYFIGPSDFEIDDMIEAFKKRIIKIKSGNNKKSYFYLSCNNNDTLFISLNEKNYIFKKLSRMKVYPWESDISHNLNLIQPDQIDKIFQDSTKKCTDFYKQFYASRYYTISRPIFIRNKKLCFFFYTIQGRGLLDIHGDFSIYSKKNRIWQHLTYITIWEG